MKTILVAVPCKPYRGTGYTGVVACNICVMTGTASTYTKLVPRRNPHGTRADLRQRRTSSR